MYVFFSFIWENSLCVLMLYLQLQACLHLKTHYFIIFQPRWWSPYWINTSIPKIINMLVQCQHRPKLFISSIEISATSVFSNEVGTNIPSHHQTNTHTRYQNMKANFRAHTVHVVSWSKFQDPVILALSKLPHTPVQEANISLWKQEKYP